MGSSLSAGVALTVAAAAIGATATATPAAASDYEGPRPLAGAVQYVKAGEATWVRAYWTTRRDICDAQVTVAGKNVKVVYPDNTGTYTSFRRGATLAAGRADYTAFKVTARADSSRAAKLAVTITYTLLPKKTFKPGVDPEDVDCDGKERARLTWITLPVIVDQDD
jgi:hypothetical protein